MQLAGILNRRVIAMGIYVKLYYWGKEDIENAASDKKIALSNDQINKILEKIKNKNTGTGWDEILEMVGK